jgi:hypothetical protein
MMQGDKTVDSKPKTQHCKNSEIILKNKMY